MRQLNDLYENFTGIGSGCVCACLLLQYKRGNECVILGKKTSLTWCHAKLGHPVCVFQHALTCHTVWRSRHHHHILWIYSVDAVKRIININSCKMKSDIVMWCLLSELHFLAKLAHAQAISPAKPVRVLPHPLHLVCLKSLKSSLVQFVWPGVNAANALGCTPNVDQTIVPRPTWRNGLGTLSNELWSSSREMWKQSDPTEQQTKQYHTS